MTIQEEKKDEYAIKLYNNENEFIQEYSYNNNEGHIKVNNKYITFTAYGKYMIKKLYNRINIDLFYKNYYFTARYIKNVEVNKKIYSIEDFNNNFYNLMNENNGHLRYSINYHLLETEQEIMDALNDKKVLSACIIKKKTI